MFWQILGGATQRKILLHNAQKAATHSVQGLPTHAHKATPTTWLLTSTLYRVVPIYLDLSTKTTKNAHHRPNALTQHLRHSDLHRLSPFKKWPHRARIQLCVRVFVFFLQRCFFVSVVENFPSVTSLRAPIVVSLFQTPRPSQTYSVMWGMKLFTISKKLKLFCFQGSEGMNASPKMYIINEVKTMRLNI